MGATLWPSQCESPSRDGDDDDDEDDYDDNDDNINIMMMCLYVTKNHHFLKAFRLFVIQPARRGWALRALGLLLADGAPTVGRGKTF